MDDSGNVVLLSWINAKLTREAAAKAYWENLSANDMVEQILRSKGGLRKRE